MSRWLVRTIAALLLVAAEGSAGTPRLQLGGLPDPPSPQVTAGGEVLLEVEVGARGAVARMTTLRATPPFTDLVRAAVARWTFEPAAGDAGGARALVVGVFRPPILGPGPVTGTPPRDVGSPSPAIPFPLDVVVPPYPITAVGDGQVLIEVSVGRDGGVSDARVLEALGPFAEPALQAAREWRFRPGRREGQPVVTLAYLIFGFRSPVTPRRPAPGS